MSDLKPILEHALNELIFGNNYEAKLKVIEALAIVASDESIDNIRNTRQAIKDRLVEAMNKLSTEVKSCDADVESYRWAIEDAIEAINSILDE